MATMSRVAEAQYLADAYGAPPQPGELGRGSLLPSASFGLRSSSDLESPGRCMRGLQFVEQPSYPQVSSPAPPLPAPSREMVPDAKNWCVLRPNPQIHLTQSKRYAEAALAHYNRRKKIKLELVDVKPYTSVPEPHCCYTHINFTARSIKEGTQEQLFFTELFHWGIRWDNIAARSRKKGSQRSFSGRSQSSRGFSVTCCEPLGPDATVGQKFLKPDVTSGLRKHADFTYCFACHESMSHPKGEKYIAGHCNIPYIYDSIR